MNRRCFLKNCALSIGVFSLSGCTSNKTRSLAQTQQKTRPNILIIYADDLGYGDLGCYNPASKIPTPNLGKLASEGMRFTDGHSSSGICTPSRYALLTGRYHWRKFHRIVGSFGESKFDSQRLTMPEMLKEKGYRTACIGKWHLGWNWDAIRVSKGVALDGFDWTKSIPDGPLDHGFDYYFGDDVPNFPPYTWLENDRVLAEPTVPLVETPKTAEGRWEARKGPMVPDWKFDEVMPKLTERAVEWIGQQKKSDKPFFLYFPFTSPHAPIVPTKEFIGKSEASGYGDFMVQTDWTVGQVLKALDDNGFTDNTLVIFTSDNGPERYAFERVRKYNHRNMGELRGLKRDIWEGGHRVPFVVRWPGVIEPGRVSNAMISQIDLMATLAGIVGYDLPETAAEDSFDQFSVWKDNADMTAVRHSHVHNTLKSKYAIRKDNWVLVDYKTGSMSKMPNWFIKENKYDINMPNGGLYDLNEDIGQRKNYIEKYPEKATELRKLLGDIRNKGCSAPRLENYSN